MPCTFHSAAVAPPRSDVMKQMVRLVAAASTLAALATTSACKGRGAADDAFRPLDVGMAVPSYLATTLARDTVRIGGAEAPTVLNVWATWCVSCAEEMNALDSLQQEFGARGLRVIGVSVDQGDAARVQRFVEANHLQFTIAHDPSAVIEQQFQVVGVPTTFVISRDGRLLWSHAGNIGPVMADARRAITTAIGGSE